MQREKSKALRITRVIDAGTFEGNGRRGPRARPPFSLAPFSVLFEVGVGSLAFRAPELMSSSVVGSDPALAGCSKDL